MSASQATSNVNTPGSVVRFVSWTSMALPRFIPFENGQKTIQRIIEVSLVRDRFNNPMGRLLGPKGATIKWVREKTGCEVYVDTNATKYRSSTLTIVVRAKDVPAAVDEKLENGVKVVLSILDQNEKTSHMSDYQLFHPEDPRPEGFEWKPENFSAGMAAPTPNEILFEQADKIMAERTAEKRQASSSGNIEPSTSEAVSQQTVLPTGGPQVDRRGDVHPEVRSRSSSGSLHLGHLPGTGSQDVRRGVWRPLRQINMAQHRGAHHRGQHDQAGYPPATLPTGRPFAIPYGIGGPAQLARPAQVIARPVPNAMGFQHPSAFAMSVPGQHMGYGFIPQQGRATCVFPGSAGFFSPPHNFGFFG